MGVTTSRFSVLLLCLLPFLCVQGVFVARADAQAWAERIVAEPFLSEAVFAERCGASFAAWLFADSRAARELVANYGFREGQYKEEWQEAWMNVYSDPSHLCEIAAIAEIDRRHSGTLADVLKALVYRKRADILHAASAAGPELYERAMAERLVRTAGSDDPNEIRVIAHLMSDNLSNAHFRRGLYGGSIDFEAAVAWLLEKEAAGYQEAKLALAVAYEFGVGTERDEMRTLELIEDWQDWRREGGE